MQTHPYPSHGGDEQSPEVFFNPFSGESADSDIGDVPNGTPPTEGMSSHPKYFSILFSGESADGDIGDVPNGNPQWRRWAVTQKS